MRWLTSIVLMVAVFVVAFWAIQTFYFDPLDEQCEAEGGHRYEGGRGYICIDDEGRIIEL